MCNECNEPTITSPCKYTGADLPCVGIIQNETIDSAITKIADTICNLTPTFPKTVLYTERALGPSSITTSLTSVTGTSYTVPAGGDGEYEITYVGQYHTPVVGTLSLRLYKGLIEYNSIVRRTVSGEVSTITPFTLFASNINLIAGDTIVIKATATTNTYAQNAICKVTKIS